MTKARVNADNASADIQGVTAGTGLTGGGTSGTVTLDVDTTTIQARVANVTDTEIGYLDGVSSAIQTQLNAKANNTNASITGTVVATGQITGSAASSGVGLKSEAAGSAEGGQLNLAPAPTGGTGSDAIIDVNGTALRITPNNFGVLVRLGTDYATTGSVNIRNIYMSTSDPSGGSDGDVWIKYTA